MNPCHGGSKCPMEQLPIPPIDVLEKHWPTHVMENDTVKNPKGAKKLLKAQKRQEPVRKAVADAIKARDGARAVRLTQLETLRKNAPDELAARHYAYLITRELLKAGVPDDFERLIAAMQRGVVPPSQEAAIAAASAGSIGNALGPAVNRRGLNPRDALLAVRDSKAVSETLPGQTQLPSLVELHRMQKDLEDADTPADRERAGYILTRANLIRAHHGL